jgi:hypothetical protein
LCDIPLIPIAPAASPAELESKIQNEMMGEVSFAENAPHAFIA